jgi:hypothetical protein
MSDEVLLGATLAAAEWKFAKTMPTIPHEYTVGERWTEELGGLPRFFWAANMVVKYGRWEFFMKRPRFYFYPGDGYRYWVMSDDPMNCKIINREQVTIRDPKPATVPERRFFHDIPYPL